MSDVNVLYIVTAVVVAGLALWAGIVQFTAKNAVDESPREGDVGGGPGANGQPEPEPKKARNSEAPAPKRQVVILDETPPPATIEVSAPSERAVAIGGKSAPIVIMPAMRQRLDSHTEIRDDGSEAGAGVAGANVVNIVGAGGASADEGDEPAPQSQVPWSLVSAIGRSEPTHGPTERSAIVNRHRLFILADGRGQRVQNELISAVVVDAVAAAFEVDADATVPADPALPPRADRLRRAVLSADAKLRRRVETSGEAGIDLGRVGLLAAHFSPDNRHLYIATAGPDRAYRMRAQEVVQLNKGGLLAATGEGVRAVEMQVAETAAADVYVFGSDAAFLALGDELRAVLTIDPSIDRVAAHFVAAATREGTTLGMTAIVVRVDAMRPSVRPPAP